MDVDYYGNRLVESPLLTAERWRFLVRTRTPRPEDLRDGRAPGAEYAHTLLIRLLRRLGLDLDGPAPLAGPLGGVLDDVDPDHLVAALALMTQWTHLDPQGRGLQAAARHLRPDTLAAVLARAPRAGRLRLVAALAARDRVSAVAGAPAPGQSPAGNPRSPGRCARPVL